MRAATYARFSTDKQSETSIGDQERSCRARADALGLTVVAAYSDAAVSGSTPPELRPGTAALIAAARAGTFTVLIVESLDRLSRDSDQQGMLLKRLEHRGVRVVAIDGYDSASGPGRKILRGFRGLQSEAYIDDLREKTHRGLVGQLERGYHAGGLSFGYRSVVAGVDARGEPIGHRLEVDQAQAAIVREVFTRFANGESCFRIADELNRRGVRGPRGGTWSVSALFGSPAKGSGILNNELYIGRSVWNRSRWTKDPDTGKRERIDRPRAEWRIAERPELRIVSDSAWQAVRARMAGPKRGAGRRTRGAQPATLFSGLMRCGICGGKMIALSRAGYACSAHKNRGSSVCRGLWARREPLDAMLLGYVRDAIADPSTLAALEREAMARAERAGRELARSSDGTRERSAQLRQEIARLVDGIATVGASPALAARLRTTESELEGLERAQRSADVTPLRSAIRARVRGLVNDLAASLTQDMTRARDALGAALGDIRIVKDDGVVYAEFQDVTERMLLAVGGDFPNRVAGACNLIRKEAYREGAPLTRPARGPRPA